MRNYKIFIEGDIFDKGTGALPKESKITTKIAPVAVEDANSEIEKGELVLDPKTGALHKALGKPHSKGGTPVNLKNDSFIFSNFKDLAINKDQKKLFEFKLGGNKAKNNTPSKILEKEVDLEHHNRMVNILQNEKKFNAPTLNAAKLMVLRNLEKAGQVAFLQESKKGSNVPEFAQNTAPIYSKDTDMKISQSKQYLQVGGIGGGASEGLPENYGSYYTYGPNGEILKQFDKDGNLIKDFNVTIATQNATIPTQQVKSRANASTNQPPYPDTWINYKDKTNRQSYTAPSWINPKDFYATPGLIDYMKTLNDYKGIDNDMGKADDSHWGWRHQAALEKFFPRGKKIAPPEALPPIVPTIPSTIPLPGNPLNRPVVGGNKAGDAEGLIDPTTYNTKLTPWQKFNAAIPFYRAATIKTQYPIRQHQESVIPQFENINAQPQLNQANQGYFNAANTLRTLNPTQASSYIAQLAGNRIDSTNQILGNIQNQNAQTQNNQKGLAAQSLNNDAAQNRAFDKQFYDSTQTAIKNRDDLKQAYEQQGVQGINDMMSKKLAFDSWLNTQQQYRGKATYKDKDGIQHYQGNALYTPKPNFWGNTVQYNPAGIDWKTYQSTQNSKDNSVDEDIALLKAYKEAFPTMSEDNLAKLVNGNKNRRAIKNYSEAQPPQKMGGKFKIRTKNKLY